MQQSITGKLASDTAWHLSCSVLKVKGGFSRQKWTDPNAFAVIHINCLISQPQGGEKRWMHY
jgi:hypothetical protein